MKATQPQASPATSAPFEGAVEPFEESEKNPQVKGPKKQIAGQNASSTKARAREHASTPSTAVTAEKNNAAANEAMSTAPRAASLQSASGDAELNALDKQIKQRVDEQVLQHQFNYSWMPNPVTLSEAYQATGAKSAREFLQKISDQDPEAMRLGFTDRAFFDSELRKIMLESAQKVALEIVDSRLTESPAQSTKGAIVWDRKELIGHLLQQGQQSSALSATPKAESAQAKAVTKKLQRDLKQLDSPMAQLVSSGLELALFERKAANDDANFIKNFNRRPLTKKLEFLTQYIAEHYGPQNANVARHSALDNPLILGFVENNLSSQDRNIFLTRFRSRNVESAAQAENS